MAPNILFVDPARQNEIEAFFAACQSHRDYYRGLPNSLHPLTYFREPTITWQCAPDLNPVYLATPASHVKYKHPAALPTTLARTSGIPTLPERTLAGRYSKKADFVYVR